MTDLGVALLSRKRSEADPGQIGLQDPAVGSGVPNASSTSRVHQKATWLGNGSFVQWIGPTGEFSFFVCFKSPPYLAWFGRFAPRPSSGAPPPFTPHPFIFVFTYFGSHFSLAASAPRLNTNVVSLDSGLYAALIEGFTDKMPAPRNAAGQGHAFQGRPTNHLDAVNVAWLETCTSIVSHDSSILNNTITNVLHLNRFKQLYDINLQVSLSSCVAVLGPNGSGKSMLVELLIGDMVHRMLHSSSYQHSHKSWYEAYSPVFMTATMADAYSVTFSAFSPVVVHTQILSLSVVGF
ncbi:hypothetical protein EDD22DRAFT_960949 [Suillus occidentalis]|nr:hypothetical protein EDD22DRAFT_960949 [Suillus occidentalis]